MPNEIRKSVFRSHRILLSAALLVFALSNAYSTDKPNTFAGGSCITTPNPNFPDNVWIIALDGFSNYGASSVNVSCPFSIDGSNPKVKKGWIKILDWNSDSDISCALDWKPTIECLIPKWLRSKQRIPIPDV